LANGPLWQLLRLNSAEDVLAATPASTMPDRLEIGLAGPHTAGGEADWEVRAFFGKQGGNLAEDPVTGSLNAGIAMHLFASGHAQGSYIAAQGRKTGADGRVHCSIDAQGAVWVGGKVATIAAGAALAP
jgi:predicted PhzF superfamily epimerase YddE/YHI9